MRTEELNNDWNLTGRIPGAALPDVAAECTLPFALEDMAQHCVRESLFLRAWELTRWVERPQETPHSHAERTFLTLDGVYGAGELLMDGNPICSLQPRMECEITQYMHKGAALITLRFSPHFPQLYPGEWGKELPVETALISASVRNIYLLRICEILAQEERVSLRMLAYGSGKVRVCLRLLYQEQLLWSENFDHVVHVGEQTILRQLPQSFDATGAVLRASIDMGGEGCDTAVAPYVPQRRLPQYFAHFRKLPNMSMLLKIRQAGFEAVVLHLPANRLLRTQCADIGLELMEECPAISLCTLFGREIERQDLSGVLSVPMPREEEAHSYRQMKRLCEAACALRSKGEEVHVLALCRQSDAQDGLFDAKGNARPAIPALKNALGKYALWAEGEKIHCFPGGAYSQRILLLCAVPDGQAAIVEAALHLLDGTQVTQRSFPVCCNASCVQVGDLAAQLPFALGAGLILRLRMWRGDKMLAQHHVHYPCKDENGNLLALPQADLTATHENGVYAICNASDTAAVGVNVIQSEKILLCRGVLLPQERILLPQEQEIAIWYANPIRKGGKDIVAKRILRGVFGS